MVMFENMYLDLRLSNDPYAAFYTLRAPGGSHFGIYNRENTTQAKLQQKPMLTESEDSAAKE